MDAIKTFDQKGPFDVVLLDVQLPDMDGFAVCQALRRVDKDVPVVFVTGKNDLKDYQTGREAGGDSYLVKPISRGALRSIVGLFTKINRRGGEGGAGA
jgi:DNA-binding response OmpR family regulator